MAPRPALRAHLSLFVVVIILLACSATGMLAGTFAHTLASEHPRSTSTNGPVVSGTPPVQAVATLTPTPTATETPATVNPTTGFTLRITLSRRTLSAGDTFMVTVVATANGAPLAGLTCSLRAPTGGPPGLFATWPAPASTDANGKAIWKLTAPAVAAGTYGIEATAVGTKQYEFHRYVTLTIA